MIVRSGGIEISYASQLNFIFRLGENVSRVMGKNWLTPLTEKQQLELSTRVFNLVTLKFCFNWRQANIFELVSTENKFKAMTARSYRKPRCFSMEKHFLNKWFDKYSTYPLIRTYFFRFSLNGFLCKWCLVEF